MIEPVRRNAAVTQVAVPLRGFSVLLERERSLHLLINEIDSSFAQRSAATEQILRSQSQRVADNIALLEHRYDLPLASEDLIAWPFLNQPAPSAPEASSSLLKQLLEQHLAIVALVDGQARNAPASMAKSILTQVSRNHEEMAWILIALRKAEGKHELGSRRKPS